MSSSITEAVYRQALSDRLKLLGRLDAERSLCTVVADKAIPANGVQLGGSGAAGSSATITLSDEARRCRAAAYGREWAGSNDRRQPGFDQTGLSPGRAKRTHGVPPGLPRATITPTRTSGRGQRVWADAIASVFRAAGQLCEVGRCSPVDL